jgi:3-hydroxy-9,10-secoandrosta-1,3,5(10)-triene-9,17-dione monooxygenase reductase component
MTATEVTKAAVPRRLPFDDALVRKVLGHFCTGVAVVTANHAGQRPVGFTCQSVAAVSLEPPYISFCPAKTSSSWALMRDSGVVCVNILAAEQRSICAVFARSGADKFAGVNWHRGWNGAPVLDGTLASIEANVEFEHEAGDHTIVVARVSSLYAHEHREPLLFFRSGYGVFSADLGLHA